MMMVVATVMKTDEDDGGNGSELAYRSERYKRSAQRFLLSAVLVLQKATMAMAWMKMARDDVHLHDETLTIVTTLPHTCSERTCS